MAAKELNLYQKLAKIRRSVEVLQKDKSAFNYRYVTDAAILAKITGLMDNLHVSLIPSIVPGTSVVKPYEYIKTKANKKTGEIYDERNSEIIVQADAVYTWVNDDDPSERIEVPWLLVGQQEDASQSFGSGMTYTYRYFLLKYFGSSTVEDDPDSWRAKQKESAEAESRETAEKLIGEVDIIVRQFCVDNPEKTDDMQKFLSRYVKSGAYRKITEPVLAAKLLDDLKNFVKGE